MRFVVEEKWEQVYGDASGLNSEFANGLVNAIQRLYSKGSDDESDFIYGKVIDIK